MKYTNMDEYFMNEAENEFQDEVKSIIEIILNSNGKYELSEIPEIIFSWDSSNNTMNASAKRIENDLYKITVNTFTPWHLKKELLWNKIKTQNINATKEVIVHSFISHILSFIIWHEYYHIAFGHCTIPQYRGEFNENISADKGSFERQQFEVMCDLAAARKFASDVFIIYQQNNQLDGFMWLFALLYIYFLEQENIKLSNINNFSVEEIININRTHPFPTIRFMYTLDVLISQLKNHYSMSDNEIDTICNGSNNILREINCFDDGFNIITDDHRIDEYINRLCDINLDILLANTQKKYIRN